MFISLRSVCARPSCRKAFDPESLEPNACCFHPGGPLFHEGLKSWTCCSSQNRPVLSFEEFEAIPGCATGTHTLERPLDAVPAKSRTADLAAAALKRTAIHEPSHPNAAPSTAVSAIPPRPQRRVVPTPPEKQSAALQDDPPNVLPAIGSSCRRAACVTTYQNGMERSDEECVHHIGTPVFHDGSQGWSCCKRRVLDFADFLKIEGCARGRHVFLGAAPADASAIAPPRTDHYQTPTTVVASIFLKAVDASQSRIDFTHWTLSYELTSKSGTRAVHLIDLFGPIQPDRSAYRVLGTKVEVTLAKADGRSWPTLELGDSDSDMPVRGANFTFGTIGKGTVGSKEASFAPI